MINPLQLYMLLGRPIGIWLAGTCMTLQAGGHIGISMEGNESCAALIFVLLLFLVSLVLLVMRRVSAALYGTSFFIIGLYKAAEMFVHGSPVQFVFTVIWCSVSLVGIASLLFNRRWFDERIVRFTSSVK